MPTLPNDVARCDGVSYTEKGGKSYWRDGCERCLRRLAPRPAEITLVMPPDIITFECELLIDAADA